MDLQSKRICMESRCIAIQTFFDAGIPADRFSEAARQGCDRADDRRDMTTSQDGSRHVAGSGCFEVNSRPYADRPGNLPSELESARADAGPYIDCLPVKNTAEGGKVGAD